MKSLLNIFVILCIFLDEFTFATMCKPNSEFKIDCDICRCSSDGTEYSCTNRNCVPEDDSYSDSLTFNVDNNRLRNPRIPMPYSRENYVQNPINDLSSDEMEDEDFGYGDLRDAELNIDDNEDRFVVDYEPKERKVLSSDDDILVDGDTVDNEVKETVERR